MPVIPATPWTANSTVSYADQSYQNGTRPPVVSTVPTYAAATKFVTVAGAGTSDGSVGNEWTLDEAMTNTVAGDIVGLAAGVYVGTDPGAGAGNTYTPAFRPSNSGTSENPIWFVAENPAAINVSGYTDIRSGATTQDAGWPSFGALTKDYVNWVGIYTDNNDTNNKQLTDSGTCVMRTVNDGGVYQCKLLGQTTTNNDNYAGIRVEYFDNGVIEDNECSGFVGGQSNASGITVYKSNSNQCRHNSLHNNGNGIHWKGADGTSTINDWNFYENDMYSNTIGMRIGGIVKGASGETSYIRNNIIRDSTAYGIEFTSSGTTTGEQNGLMLFNNTFYSNSDGDVRINHAYQSDGVVPRDNRFFNNIYSSGGSYLRATYAGASDITHHDNFGVYQNNCIYNMTQFGDGTTGSALESLTFSAWTTTWSQDADSITSNPMFTDTATNDFTLQVSSPAELTGIDLLGVYGTVDDPVDMGAYVTGSETIGVR